MAFMALALAVKLPSPALTFPLAEPELLLLSSEMSISSRSTLLICEVLSSSCRPRIFYLYSSSCYPLRRELELCCVSSYVVEEDPPPPFIDEKNYYLLSGERLIEQMNMTRITFLSLSSMGWFWMAKFCLSSSVKGYGSLWRPVMNGCFRQCLAL